MNGHNDDNNTNANQHQPEVLCRYEEGYGPIVLEKLTTAEGVSCELLEDALDDPLDPTIEFPVEYPQLDDALLLHCRLPRPKSLLQEANSKQSAINNESPIASITGLPEEFSGRKPSLTVSVYKGTTDSSNQISNFYEAPQLPWTRQALNDVPLKPQKPKNIDVMWVDLRTCIDKILFPSLTSVAHFFRSLMSTSHGVSPWYPPGSQPMPNAHRIGVLFQGKAPDILFDVRVGDVCPSWCLYSISRVKIPEIWSPWESTHTNIAQLEAATLLIFKPLPPRPLFSTVPPKIAMDESHLTELPEGCLYEVYYEYPEGDDNDSEEKKKQTPPKARKIPHCRMTAPPYLSHMQEYDESMLQALMDNWKVIRDEALRIPQWTPWPEKNHYSSSRAKRNNLDDSEDDDDSGNPTWNVFPLCHCFPANQIENKKWIDQTCALVPQTTQLLKQHLGPVLRTALFSRLDPETTLEAHTGWSDLANHVYRCHLSLVVPPGGVCGTWVDGCVATHEEGRFLCFDDSKTHRAFNYSSKERIVLILDLARPEHLPLGTATGGHSDELDQFIAQMNV